MVSGQVYLAPDGFQMRLGAAGKISLTTDEPENGLRPSVSCLFRSVANAYGRQAIGVLLTGMGKDGAEELRLMKEKGSITIAQDEESSVVHGMPGEAIRLGGASYVLSPNRIAAALTTLAATRGSGAMNSEGRGPGPRVEILVVEDSPTQAEKLRFLLEAEGYIVNSAVNGTQALAMLDQRKPTLVITDVVMPEMDGFTLCKAIKSRESLKDLPVILMTSLSSPRDILKGLECGADNFIRKPFDEQILIARIKSIF